MSSVWGEGEQTASMFYQRMRKIGVSLYFYSQGNIELGRIIGGKLGDLKLYHYVQTFTEVMKHTNGWVHV